MRGHGIGVDIIRAIDHGIAAGVWPDMATLTLDLYGHLFENRLDEVAERLDAAARADAAVAPVLPEAQVIILKAGRGNTPPQ